jgi:anti-anti-sigma regulatory factor
MNDAVNNHATSVDGAPAAGRVVLSAACTIREAAQLRTQLLSCAGQPGPYQIDGAAVEAVDAAGVQVLVAFALDCLERNARYTWLARSPALEEAIRVLGVGALLESPS